MTDQNLTEIIAVIDRSGSMETLRTETIGGYNNFLNDQKKGEGRAIMTLVQFDDEYQIDYQGVDVNNAPPLTDIDLSEVKDPKLVNYTPRGMTALLDAVGKTITTVGERLAKLPEEERPGEVIFLIITDGHENSSQEYKAERVKEMVRHQTEKYSWTFVFMGGGDIESQVDQGKSLGVAAANAVAYTADSRGYGCMFGSVSTGVTRRRQATSEGQRISAEASLLTDEEKKKQITEE